VDFIALHGWDVQLIPPPTLDTDLVQGAESRAFDDHLYAGLDHLPDLGTYFFRLAVMKANYCFAAWNIPKVRSQITHFE
jgi:hypothetical protein